MQLRAPSLMIHAKDDPWGAHEGARRVDGGAPHARFVEFDDGGHLFTGHTGQARAVLSQFIRRTAAPAPGASAR